jgi:hypothetical protein
MIIENAEERADRCIAGPAGALAVYDRLSALFAAPNEKGLAMASP